MCIIAIKPKNVKAPNQHILRNMFMANPDGAGVAFNHKGNLHIVKGLMTFDEFYEICSQIPDESAVIYHARIQTSGGICKELTHPFLLDKNIEKQRQTIIKIDKGQAVAHNGIFNEFSTKEQNNDTTQFISTYLYPLKHAKDLNNGSILDDDFDKIIQKLCGLSNRLAIIDEKGNTKKYGDGWIYDDGIYYSNDSYEDPIYKLYDYDYFRYPCMRWNKKDIDKKAQQNIHDQIEDLRKIDPEFNAVYKRWQYHMTESEILECYENGWI